MNQAIPTPWHIYKQTYNYSRVCLQPLDITADLNRLQYLNLNDVTRILLSAGLSAFNSYATKHLRYKVCVSSQWKSHQAKSYLIYKRSSKCSMIQIPEYGRCGSDAPRLVVCFSITWREFFARLCFSLLLFPGTRIPDPYTHPSYSIKIDDECGV